MSVNAALEAAVTHLKLPTMPEIMVKIQTLLQDAKSGPLEIGAAVAADPTLTAKILRVANSSHYGLRAPVLTSEQAAVVIGVRTLKNIALQVSVMQRYQYLSQHADFDLEEVWGHAMAVAELSRELATMSRHTGGLAPEEFYTCGLLHDIGKVVLLETYGERYLDVLRHARQANQALHLSEEVVLGFTHVDVGALLAQKWLLPERVAAAIEFHHGPTEKITGDPTVSIVAICDQLHYRAQSQTQEASLERLAKLAVKLLGVEPEAFRAFARRAWSPAERAL